MTRFNAGEQPIKAKKEAAPNASKAEPQLPESNRE
jgi:hypothetical protein